MPRKKKYTVNAEEPVEGQLIPSEAGRPSLYKPEMCQITEELMSKGKTNAQVCAVLGISPDSFMRYRRDYPELAAAYEKGKVLQQAYWENVGMNGIVGEIKGFNATTYIFMMSNLFKGQYTQKAADVTVNVNNNTLHQEIIELSNEELDAKIKLLKGE
jgi:hypothetical protein